VLQQKAIVDDIGVVVADIQWLLKIETAVFTWDGLDFYRLMLIFSPVK